MKTRSDTRSAQKRKSFLKGFASAFDLSGRTLVRPPNLSNGSARDAAALGGDWKKVGFDIRGAMDSVAHGS